MDKGIKECFLIYSEFAKKDRASDTFWVELISRCEAIGRKYPEQKNLIMLIVDGFERGAI